MLTRVPWKPDQVLGLFSAIYTALALHVVVFQQGSTGLKVTLGLSFWLLLGCIVVVQGYRPCMRRG